MYINRLNDKIKGREKERQRERNFPRDLLIIYKITTQYLSNVKKLGMKSSIICVSYQSFVGNMKWFKDDILRRR